MIFSSNLQTPPGSPEISVINSHTPHIPASPTGPSYSPLTPIQTSTDVR